MPITEALNKGSSRKTRREKLRQAMTKQLIGEETTEMGRGLVALADFAPGEVVAPIDGEHTWGGEELCTLPPDPLEDYSFVCDMLGGRYRKTDPVLENLGWHLANHSCSPNARLSIVMMAERRIAKGEPITVHYGWQTERSAEMKCLCGAPACYGTVGPRVHGLKSKTEEIEAWRAYLDAMIANRNVQGLRSLRSSFNEQSFQILVENAARSAELDKALSKTAVLFEYELPLDRIVNVSF